MKRAYIFPGQGAQFTGMGKALCESDSRAKELFEKANEILGFRLSDIMFEGSEEELVQTRVTQPAVFLHSVAIALTATDFAPAMVAGHSLGEFSALVAARCLTFEDGLQLVSQRASAMQEACERNPSTMAAILNLDDAIVEQICQSITGEVVVAANYNCPGQLVISGTIEGVRIACEKCLEAGAKRALPLKVGGAFHSPLMEPARIKLEEAINNTSFSEPICPVFQNVDAQPSQNPKEIQQKLIAQLTGPVRWTQIVHNMKAQGATEFIEMGPGRALSGMVKKVDRDLITTNIE